MTYGIVNADSMVDSNGGSMSPSSSIFRNRIINGSMVIDQRNAGASVTPTSGQYLVDRFAAYLTQASKFTAQQNAGAVTPPTGFTKYLGVTSSSAYSVLSTDYFFLSQAIEGFNVADLAWGTASAATVTLSFWVRSSLTGTFGGSLRNGGANRSYPYTYTISAANTWEQKTIAMAGDTSGTWATDNTQGIYLSFGLGVGTTTSGTAGSWAATNYFSATGATSVVGTNGATFYITGVQLEKGSTATSFDYRPYGTELALCQRYLPVTNLSTHAGQCYATTAYLGSCSFQVNTRTSPTGITVTPSLCNVFNGALTSTVPSAVAFSSATNSEGSFTATTTGLTLGQSGAFSGLILWNGCEL